MKKRVGILFGKPIIKGDFNDLGYNEYLYEEVNGIITLYAKNSNGEIYPLTRIDYEDGKQNDTVWYPTVELEETITEETRLLIRNILGD